MASVSCKHNNFTDSNELFSQLEIEIHKSDYPEFMWNATSMLALMTSITAFILGTLPQITSYAGSKTQTAHKYTLLAGSVTFGLALIARQIPRPKLLSKDDVPCEICKKLVPLKNNEITKSRELSFDALTFCSVFYAGMALSPYFFKDKFNLIPVLTFISSIAIAAMSQNNDDEPPLDKAIQKIVNEKFL
ncbi:MAG: hypothetical protein SNF33_00705 [Candidatus Algichlamydia australiensis]|nr:hypothetical protein [Chlamydiales bacterium]